MNTRGPRAVQARPMLHFLSCLTFLSLSFLSLAFTSNASADDELGSEPVLYGILTFEAVAAVGIPFSVTREDDDFASASLTGTSLLALGAGFGVAALAAVFDWPPAIPAAIHLAAWGTMSVLLTDLLINDEFTAAGAITAGLLGALCFTGGLFTDNTDEAAIALLGPIGLAAYLAFMFLGGFIVFVAGDDDTQEGFIVAGPIVTATTTVAASIWIMSGEADRPSVSVSPTAISGRF